MKTNFSWFNLAKYNKFRSIELDVPGVTVDQLTSAFAKELEFTQTRIIDDIQRVAKYDEQEFNRIITCHRDDLYDEESPELEKFDKIYVDKAPTSKEVFLSLALMHLDMSVISYSEGIIEKAFEYFSSAIDSFMLSFQFENGSNHSLPLKKYQIGPKEKQRKTHEFWCGYRKIFDKFIATGRSESWAINKIGDIIEREGVWKKKSKKNADILITRPDRGTLRKQLVTNRK